jgi:hypothetical protein
MLGFMVGMISESVADLQGNFWMQLFVFPSIAI